MYLHICIRTHLTASHFCLLYSLFWFSRGRSQDYKHSRSSRKVGGFSPTSKQRIFCSLYRVNFPSLLVTQSITHHWIRVPTEGGIFFSFLVVRKVVERGAEQGNRLSTGQGLMYCKPSPWF
jgi:hypothetical protein